MTLPHYYLIRHGELHNPQGLFYGRSVDLDLNAVGREQIDQLGRMIKHQGIVPEVLITSPMKRTLQTAQILSVIFDEAPIIQSDDLLEVGSTGFEGWKLQKLFALEDYFNNPPPGVVVERIVDIAQRMRRAIMIAQKEYKGKHIGFVSHGDPIAIAQWSLLHPDIPFASTREILGYSPAKGDAWKIQLHADGTLGDYELIHAKINHQEKERRS